MAALSALSGLAGTMGLFGAGFTAGRLHQNNDFPSFEELDIKFADIRENIFLKKDDEHFPRHDISCKSRKDAKDKAQEYGGGEPPEGPHHDGFGSHFHPMRRRQNKRIKIPNVHFKYQIRRPFIYKIQRGDCLGKIAEKFNVTVQNLVKWNNIPNPDLIYEGHTLKIF